MKKVLFFLAIVVLAYSLNSCASKRKGCGLTAETKIEASYTEPISNQ